MSRASFGFVWCVLMVVLSVSAGTLPSTPGEELARYEFRRILMGVEARIGVGGADQDTVTNAVSAAFDRIAGLDTVLSDYRADSEAMQLCAGSGTESVSVSEDLFAVLRRAGELSNKTDGAFDVTVGPVVRLWREARRSGSMPARDELAEARTRLGWTRVELNEAARSVRLTTSGMRLDFGGIGKGYAAQAAIDVLRAHGLERAMIDFGGDLVLGAPPPGQAGWRVAIGNRSGTSSAIELHDVAIATSGDLEQYVELDGVRYSHIVDPATGLGLTRRSVVTVIAPDGATADALASALSVAGADRARTITERFDGVSALVETAVGGTIERTVVGDFPSNG